MAEIKKETAKVIAKADSVKGEAKSVELNSVPKEEVKEAPKVEVKAASRAAAKKAPVKKEAAKKVTAKKETAKKETASKAAAKKETASRAAAKKETVKKAAAKKADVKQVVKFEFGGKSYTPEELVKITKDVWVYDLSGKEADFKEVELYVKPEESAVYYVINGNVTGSFFI